jgi:hypothetical protein
VFIAPEGGRLRAGQALFWSLTWGVGVMIGVALGGWLTLVGGSGAPGIEGLDPISDLVVLPVLAGAGVAVVHLSGQLVAAALRGRTVASAQE